MKLQSVGVVTRAASREAILSGAASDYRILHLATHGDINTEHPNLSRLVFSQVDSDGNPVDGFVYAHEIYDLELPADLVVLSACQTALGREIRGEGLVGLTQGFLYAGAARVADGVPLFRRRIDRPVRCGYSGAQRADTPSEAF